MKKIICFLVCLLAGIAGVKAQIGYQVSLLNTATGEARANEKVAVEIKLSNSAGEVFYSEKKSATTNDFGVLSLSIGNADTFKDVDFSKMPFFIEVTANGVFIGRSQILSLPVAEYAKRIGNLTKEKLVGTWISQNEVEGSKEIMTFNEDGTGEKSYFWFNEGVWEKGSSSSFLWHIVDGVHIYRQSFSDKDGTSFSVLHYLDGKLFNSYAPAPFTKQ